MVQPRFEVEPIAQDCWLIHDRGRTVATVSSQGYIDWLLRSPMEPGPRLTRLRKEAHLSYVLGLKLQLAPPHPGCEMAGKSFEPLEDASALRIIGDSRTPDGRFTARTLATLRADAGGARYFWDCRTTFTSIAREPVTLEGVEFNNIYPGKAGRCFLFAPEKEYRWTLMVDRAGVVWRFPHQHLMHYGQKIAAMSFSAQADAPAGLPDAGLAGFFGETTGSPVVIVRKASHAPDWGICDMYYDLHCMARTPKPIAPGGQLDFEYTVKYLSRAESDALLARAKPVPVTDEDRQRHLYPRLELGANGFLREVDIAGVDDASGFRPAPPARVWDRQVGHTGKGSLRLHNDTPGENVWSAEPPTQIPSRKTLRITAMARTRDVTGKGVYLRVRYHTYHWRPTPHVDWPVTLTSNAVTGTTDPADGKAGSAEGWVRLTLPPLEVPEEHFDYLIWFDVILEGTGTAWVTDVDVDLSPSPPPAPSLEQGSSKRAGRVGSGSGTVSGASPS